jgi:MFS family permease
MYLMVLFLVAVSSIVVHRSLAHPQATLLEMFAAEWRTWLAARLFAGLGNGFAQTVLVIYNSEICPAQIRGFCLSTWAFFYAFGQLTASIALQVIDTVCHDERG